MTDHRDEISMTEYRALAELRYQLRHFIRFSEQAARAAGLEPQQHQLLLALKGLPEDKKATIGALAERLQIAHHSTVELVDRLAERGLVQRKRDESDQRRVIVTLTPQGEEVLRNLSLAHRAELRSASSAFVQALNMLLMNDFSETS
jgi:DNA-binding MarR family transcriptional regulator